jgi:ribonuclease T2
MNNNQVIKRSINLKELLPLILTILLCQVSSPLFAAASKKAGEFDYYVLALSWQPAFCESKPKNPGCRDQHEGQFYATHFTLHGLWPTVKGDKRHSYKYCHVPKSILSKRRRWCNMPKLDLSNPVRKRLIPFMPGMLSCLHRHEWYKHGSCSGLSENDYYALSNQLVEKFSKTGFSQYVAKHVDQYVSRNMLLKKFDKEFGKGSRSHLALRCKKIDGTSLLTEIRIHLKKNISAINDFGQQIFPEKKIRVRGNCPRRFKIDEVGVTHK